MYPTPNPQTDYAVYIHVPFCRKRCPYCDFYLRTDANRRLNPFIEELPTEWRQRLKHPIFADGKPYSLFFGGGTPSILTTEIVGQWITEWRNLGLPESAEITLEANPEDFAKFSAFCQAGINRLSIGCQSLDDGELKELGRTHTSNDIHVAYETARSSGFASISLDFIYALPFGSEKGWKDTLTEAITMSPDHISCYALTVEEGTSYGQRWKRGEFTLPTEDAIERQLQLTFELLEPAGYDRYELSNFAHPGHESKHNLAYWTGRPYLACGPSAHGYDGVGRYANISDVDKWRDLILADKLPDVGWETLTPEQHRIETIAMQLRLKTGLQFDNPLLQIEQSKVDQVVHAGWGVLSGSRLQLTSSGLAREAAITRFLL